MTIVPTQAVAWMYDGPEGEHYVREHRDVSYNWLKKNGWTETALAPIEATRQAFLTEILDHLTTEHSGGLGSQPGARVVAEALKAKFS